MLYGSNIVRRVSFDVEVIMHFRVGANGKIPGNGWLFPHSEHPDISLPLYMALYPVRFWNTDSIIAFATLMSITPEHWFGIRTFVPVAAIITLRAEAGGFGV